MNTSKLIADSLNAIFDVNSGDIIKLLRSAVEEANDFAPALIRIAALCPGHAPLFYQQISNLWEKLGCPPLKPNPQTRKVILLTDFTSNPLIKPLKLMTAARGIMIDVVLPNFDSVEQEVLDISSSCYGLDPDMFIILLSEHWLDKYLGFASVIEKSLVDRVCNMLRSFIETIINNSRASVMIGSFYSGAWPTVSGYSITDDWIGRKAAVELLNADLINRSDGRVAVADLASALHLAGGVSAVGRRCYLLAKMAFEPSGNVFIARELASAISDVYGQTHRACALDWDNTLWGGIIAEDGPHEVVCGFDSPEANAYRLFQHQLKGLSKSGVVLAAISRNTPEIISLIDENEDIPLSSNDFASIQISFAPKSQAISAACSELGFGEEYLLFIDDMTYELAEVLMVHPFIDILRAEKDPEITLQRFTESRFFNKVRLIHDDLERSENIRILAKQRKYQSEFQSNGDFLKSIDIELSIEPISDKNRSRVLQLIHKTNQFNLTSRRHTDKDVASMIESGAEIWSFSYKDMFGSQGIISVVIVVPENGFYRIESWLMSCRVFNRTVEQAVFDWLKTHYKAEKIVAEYIPTSKNALVKNFLQGIGFSEIDGNETATTWEYVPTDKTPLKHFIAKFIEKD